MSRLLPTRSLLPLWLLLLLMLTCASTTYSIPFSTMFRRTQSLLLRHGTKRDNSNSRIPPFLKKKRNSVTTTVYSLLGGCFADNNARWSSTRRRRSCSSLASSSTVTAVPITPTSSSSSTTTQESVHLKLGSEAMLTPSLKQHDNDSDENNNHEKDSNKDDKDTSSSSPQTSLLHTYEDPLHNISLSGLNVSKRKFSSWVNHTLVFNEQECGVVFNTSYVTSKTVHITDLKVRQELRSLWNQGRLLTDRTEVLAVYKSELSDSTSTIKRGGFSDLLHIYAERLFAIIQDEEEEFHISNSGKRTITNQTVGVQEETEVPVEVLEILEHGGLLGWLQREYGVKETKRLCFENMKNEPVKRQYETFQRFLEWFRSRFPYYYDRCDSCGASAKDDPEIVCIEDDGNKEKEDTEDEEGDHDDSGSFLGYVYPSDQELLGKASRTEIYQCHKCGSFTRFPRYNSASSVIHHKRGRCGEYSMLLYRILRATGHMSRWIVDWADHVWAEVYLNGNWVHLDPCEAAVDKPLLYEEWGKQQTYIVAFHAPLANGGSFDRTCILNASVPLIEDVTLRYTSSNLEEIQKRRDESDDELAEFVDRTIVDLEQKLDRILNKR